MQGRFNSRIRSIFFVTILLVILFGSWQSQLVSSESELDLRFTDRGTGETHVMAGPGWAAGFGRDFDRTIRSRAGGVLWIGDGTC